MKKLGPTVLDIVGQGLIKLHVHRLARIKVFSPKRHSCKLLFRTQCSTLIFDQNNRVKITIITYTNRIVYTHSRTIISRIFIHKKITEEPLEFSDSEETILSLHLPYDVLLFMIKPSSQNWQGPTRMRGHVIERGQLNEQNWII